MTLTIEYCASCGYAPRALGLIDEVLAEFEDRISEMRLVPSSGGVFEVRLGDALLASKKETGEFPENAAVLAALRAAL
ncbi:MAG: SelT/SelW/SelH family protein [Actinobacteria bacterium]|nr:SelT/SelW/SelH family protein [Actinomycetota bacterium]